MKKTTSLLRPFLSSGLLESRCLWDPDPESLDDRRFDFDSTFALVAASDDDDTAGPVGLDLVAGISTSGF